MTRPQRIAVIGTVGVPANYGGFETLVENLALWHERNEAPESLSIYCSAISYENQPESFHGSLLRYVPLNANGAQSIPYDIWSMLSALRRGSNTLLVLGVSGAITLPFIRTFSNVHIVTNIDGIEWKRKKWGRLQRTILKWSEALAVRFSHEIIADNGAIAAYVLNRYGTDCTVIAYGGDHAISVAPKPVIELDPPDKYAINICRIEPENNVHMMLSAFSDRTDLPLVCIGNWNRSPYGINLKKRYHGTPGLHLLDPIYDVGKLRTLRAGASAYVHGHSAGGTNPSLVEMMHFGLPVFAYDCDFNRHSTDEKALYFSTAEDLGRLLETTSPEQCASVGSDMRDIAQARYTWDEIGTAYFNILRKGY